MTCEQHTVIRHSDVSRTVEWHFATKILIEISYIKINVNSEKIVFLVHQRILYDKIVKFLSFEVRDAISLFNQHMVPRYFAKRPANSLNLKCSAVRIVVSGNPRVWGLSFSCGYAP